MTVRNYAARLTKFESPPIHSLTTALRSEFENWFTLGGLSWLILPSRCPPRSGWPRLQHLPVDVRLRNGFRARCRIDEFSGFVEVWIYREYDVLGLNWREVRTVVDVGANVGAATLWFAAKAPSARIVAVEPSTTVIPTLIQNVQLNGLADRVTIAPVALGGTSSVGYVRASGSSTTAAVFSEPGAGRQRVNVRSLTDLLASENISDLDLLKLDCEGAEYEILRSSASVLRSIRAIVGEFHARTDDGRDEIEEVLRSAGFACRFQGGAQFGLFSAVRPPRPLRSTRNAASALEVRGDRG